MLLRPQGGRAAGVQENRAAPALPRGVAEAAERLGRITGVEKNALRAREQPHRRACFFVGDIVARARVVVPIPGVEEVQLGRVGGEVEPIGGAELARERRRAGGSGSGASCRISSGTSARYPALPTALLPPSGIKYGFFPASVRRFRAWSTMSCTGCPSV